MAGLGGGLVWGGWRSLGAVCSPDEKKVPTTTPSSCSALKAIVRARCPDACPPNCRVHSAFVLVPCAMLQVFYNNMLSLPFIAAMILVTGEVHKVWSEPDLTNPMFLSVAAVSGLIGFGIRWEHSGCGFMWL